MKTMLSFRSFVFSTLVFLGFSQECVAKPEPVNIEPIVKAAVSELYSPGHSKVYPNDQFLLDECIKRQDTACLESYERVKKAKDTLVSLPQKDTLNAILKLIPELCLSEDEWVANTDCYGAIRAFYLFNTSAHDAQMLASIKQYPRAVKTILFNAYLEWQHNRSSSEPWVTLLSNIDIDWQRHSKENVIANFSIPKPSPLWAK